MKRTILGLLATGLMAAFAANATPVTFRFDMPTWTYASLPGVFGTNAVLFVTLDNGSSSFLSQAYLNNQITGIRVTGNGGTMDDSFSGAPIGDGTSATYFSTDASGVPTLNLLVGNPESRIYWDESTNHLQLGILGPYGGPSNFYISRDPGQAYVVPFNGQLYTGFSVLGQRVPDTTVPEPGTLALLGFGLAGLGLSRRRKGA